MRKVKVKHEDREIEVELPDGWIAPDEAAEFVSKEHVENIITSRVAQAKRSMKAGLLADDAFKTEALEAWKVTPGKGGAQGGDVDKAVAEALAEYERKTLVPLKQEAEKLKGKLEGYRTRTKAARLAEAARAAGMDDPFLLAPPNGSEPIVATMFGGLFAEDEESGELFARSAKGDGFAISGKKDRAHPWQTPEDYFEEMRGKKEFSRYFKDQSQKGPGSKPANGSGNTGAGPTEIDLSDPLAISRNAEALVKGTAVGNLPAD